jgi:hypothetical protein
VLPEYDNTTSGLAATRYQTAIDELANRLELLVEAVERVV